MSASVSPSAGQAVSLRALTKSFGGRPVLSDLTLEIGAGEFLAVLGPSGSGKTTLMRIIAGFEAPDSGSVAIGGTDVTDLPAERRNVNTVFQSYALFPHLSVLDNVAFGPRMRGLGRAERERKADELLELVQLPGQGARLPRELSGGMQQRVALARALANEPAVLLLDEPLGALDRKLREELQRELRRVHQRLGTTFIYVTHDQEEAFGLADRLAVMRDGRLVQVGDPGDVYDNPASAWVAKFLGSTNSVAATLGAAGSLVSDVGPLVAGRIDPALSPGDRVVAIVRPETTRIERRSIGDGPNRLAGRLVDAVTVGAALRLKAVTANGHAFEAVASRSGQPLDGLAPGDAVSISFDADSLRVYPEERGTSHQVSSPERSSIHV
ncbi:MAG TPA: ABC transporter ATP-binding protein [Devosia sp.]|nr:ABC transporter ATP-binding protein [Devosia sp.]